MFRTALCLALATLAAAADWTVGWKNAAEAAAKANKPILANFTGSDWCSWCIKLEDEVFSTPEFAAWAKDRVVLLKVDFPNQTTLAPDLANGNQALAEKYKVDGFPTIVLLSATGTELGRLGYKEGGPKPWIAAADKILAGKP
jgi:thiol-disulfide isomerase/thioredoxin